MEQKRFELSDLVVSGQGRAIKAEVIENPYKFLNLPENASAVDARRAYIGLAKMYHPDVICHSGSQKTRELAYQNMVLLNLAYEAIKSRYEPKEWNTLFGYDFEPVHDESGRLVAKAVYLEGRGELTILLAHRDFWVAGASLNFDFAVDETHPWEAGYQQQLGLKHLFAHLEISQGREVSKILLEPFADCFGLDTGRAEQLRTLLSSGHSTEFIMQHLRIQNENQVDRKHKIVDGVDRHMYGLRFRQQLNEITTLVREPWLYQEGYLHGKPSAQIIDGQLMLEGYNQTKFSEADYFLFLTLAYGPMLKSKN